MHAVVSVIFIVGISCGRSHPGYWRSSSLSPVHGLYIKRSSDGAPGDLYVAATEDKGVKSQWVMDQPINFLPASVVQPHVAVSTVHPGLSTQHEESLTQKRSVTPNTVPSPPVQYAYAIPVPSSENNGVATYSYPYPIPASSSDTSVPKCDPSTTSSHYPFQYPFQFFYPQIMSAYANAMTILKDAGFSEDSAGTVMAQASPMWPPSSYAYPMYIMVAPSACPQNESAPTPSTSTPSPTTQDEENTET